MANKKQTHEKPRRSKTVDKPQPENSDNQPRTDSPVTDSVEVEKTGVKPQELTTEAMLEVIKRLNDGIQTLNENQKMLEEENKRLAGAVQSLYRAEATPVVVQQEQPDGKAGAAASFLKNVDIKSVLEIIKSFMSGPELPKTETQGIFSDKELQDGFKKKILADWSLEGQLRSEQLKSLQLDNILKSKRSEGEIF